MTQALKTIIAARIRTARKARHLTQADLAEKVGRTVEAISNIERALSLPPLDLLDRLASVLGLELVDLLTPISETGAAAERAALEMQIRLIASELPQDRLRIAVAQIEALRDDEA